MDRKVAVVTGASSGIGYAICNALLNENYYVLGNGRTVHDVCKSTDYFALNDSDMLIPQTSENLLNEALEKWGKCDIVCINAGMIESNSIENINIDAMCEMVRFKVEMSYRMIYTFLKYFVTSGSGHIIITSSVMGTKQQHCSQQISHR